MEPETPNDQQENHTQNNPWANAEPPSSGTFVPVDGDGMFSPSITTGSHIARDTPRQRFAVAIPLSVAVNLALLTGAGVYAHRLRVPDPIPPAELTLVREERKTPDAKPVYKPLPKPSPTPTPVPTPTPKPTPSPEPTPTPKPTPPPVNPTPKSSATPPPTKPTLAPPPEGAHNRILTAKSNANDPPKPGDHTVLSGGNARVGAAMPQQSAGNAVSAPKGPTSPVRPSATPAPQPVVVSTPAPTPVPTPVPTQVPTPKPTPKPLGPTRPAELISADKPEIPDNLKSGDFKSFVRVRVEVDASGSAESVTLRTSSGNAELDKRVADVLKRGKYKPALASGVPVASPLLFKYEFEVN